MADRRTLLRHPALWLVGAPLLFGGLVGWISYRQSSELLIQSQERTRSALASGLAVGLADSVVSEDYAGMEARLEQAMADPSIASAVVVDGAGRVLVHLERPSASAPPRLLLQPAQLAPPRQGEAPPERSASGVSIRWTPIEAAAVPVGWLRLRTWLSGTDAMLELLRRQYLVLGGLAAVVLATGLVNGYLQLRRQGRRRELALDHTAHTDQLTGLWNRRGIERELVRLLDDQGSRQPAPLALCMIDLDDFRPVNDVHGHAVGDRLLVAVSRRLKGFLREGDLVGRLGGDEFLAVLRDCPAPELALRLANRITAGLGTPFYFDHVEVRVGASIGIALEADAPGQGLEELLRRADQAMYQAKHGGKGQVAIADRPAVAA
ncbi:MAG: diguanylate cyclase domain-containing protein [Cyanobacteriota bacterium]